MDKAALIANPAASQFTGGSHRDVMAELSRGWEITPMWPASPSHARQMSADAVAEGTSLVIAMGGDGIVHHVAQGVIGTDSTLGIIPVGTTNVVARLLGVPSRPGKAVRILAPPLNAIRIGVAEAKLSADGVTTERSALFAAGFGLDAEVVIEAEKDPYRKYRFGSVHYATTALRVGGGLFPRRRPNLRVTAGARLAEATTVLVQFRPVYTYFGRFPLRLQKDDPQPMTVLVMDRLRRRRIPRIIATALRGNGLDAIKGIQTWSQVSHLEMSADPPVAAQADGELLGRFDAATVSWRPDALSVAVQASPR